LVMSKTFTVRSCLGPRQWTFIESRHDGAHLWSVWRGSCAFCNEQFEASSRTDSPPSRLGCAAHKTTPQERGRLGHYGPGVFAEIKAAVLARAPTPAAELAL
jgi:hypothetical protein